MASLRPAQHTVRFGVFEVNFAAAELRKRGRKVKLQGQPFQVLALLLQRPGEVVTREELQQALWPADTFVEFDHGVNTAIKKIRQALGDSADNPRFIETLPRKGYRFIAPVYSPEVPAPARRWGFLYAIALVACIAVAGVALWFIGRSRKAPEAAPVPVPLTSYSGRERSPSFSPDGDRVAFVWNGPKQDNYDTYVKLIGAENVQRLTTGPAWDQSCAWSPDGRWIAIMRASFDGKKWGVFLVPAIGGPERRLADVFLPILFEQPSWHPDGKWLVISDRNSPAEPQAVFLLSVETGEKRRLTSPPANYLDGDPAVSPDGRALVFVRSRATDVGDLYLLELSPNFSPKGEPKRITFEGRHTATPVWSPDGRSILYVSGSRHPASLWRVAVSGPGGQAGMPERLAFAGEGTSGPAVSRQGRLAYVRGVFDVDIWRLEVSSGQAGPEAVKPPVRLISSTRVDHVPEYSPDGNRIAFASNRSGSHEIWVCDSDGSNAVKLTSFGGPYTADPIWSPDGRWIAFGSRPEERLDAFVISSEGGRARRLVDSPANTAPMGWSLDGRWIYFFSGRLGQSQVWKVRWADGAPSGNPVQITKKGGGARAFESPDGRLLYYLKAGLEVTSLWKVPVEGGEETQVLEAVYGHNFAVVNRGIYFIPSQERPAVQFLSFATGKVVTVAQIPRSPAYGLSISPDGRWLLYSQGDDPGSDLMLVENFR